MNTHTLTLSVCTLALLIGCGGSGSRSGSGSATAPASTATTTSAVTITTLTPDQGSAQGDVEVTVTGTGFGPGAVVEFGGVPAAVVTVVTSETLLARTPAHAQGVVDVSVVLPTGDVALFPNGFTYTQPPTIRRTGVLDTSFGGSGFVTVDGGNQSYDEAWAVTTDAQGRILVAGSTNDATNDRDVAVWRYNADGTVDATFGVNGLATVDASAAGGAGWDQGNAITVDSSGRILVTGYSRNPGNNADMTVWRFTDAGQLDPSFGGQGFFTHHDTAGGDNWEQGRGIVVDGQGRIVVTGYSNTVGLSADMVVWRLTDTGQLDPTFNTTGFVTHHNAAGGDARDEGNQVALDAVGRIVVAGYSRGTASNDVAVWRFNDDGSLDTTFNSTGYVTHDGAGGAADAYEIGRGMAIDGQGRIVVIGTARGPTNNDMALWRFTEAGALDTSFNGTGFLVRDDAAGGGGTESGYKVAVDAAGVIVGVGTSLGAGTGIDIAVWQITDTGADDTGFGAGSGVFVHHDAAGGASSDLARAVTLDDRGRIVVAGSSRVSTSDTDMTIWRIQ